MPFTSKDFHDLVDVDLWIIEQMLTLPSDPEPTITHKDGTVLVDIVDTVAMPQMQDAVIEYRRQILPAIFVISQKVYAEIFHLMLASSGHSGSKSQSDVEKSLMKRISQNLITCFSPFTSRSVFQDWWSGKYNYSTLRKARNEVVHSRYDFTNGRLLVKDKKGSFLVDWAEVNILTFSSEVLKLSRTA